MNKAQRILLTMMIAFVFPVSVTIALILLGLASDNLAIWMLLLTFIIVAVGVYFLSFTIWDKTKQEAVEDGRPRTGRTMNRRQRIILALVITLVFPVNIALTLALDTLAGGIIWDLFMLIPSSIIVAVGVYFVSFIIWDKDNEPENE